MLDSETKRKIDTARDILVGKLPAPQAQIEQITIALIYKFMDDMDKEAETMGGKSSFFTGEFAKYGWSNIFDPHLGGYQIIELYTEAIDRMNHNKNIPQLFRDIFKNAYLPYRDPETLKSFLKVINEFHYDHSEKLGDAFEYLLSIMSSQGDAGQFRTPRHIIDFIVSVVEPQKNDTILDPACGTAGFLISSYKHISKENTKDGKTTLTPAEKKRLVDNIVGYDISPDMVRLSLVNLYLHGFKEPHIYEYDTLSSEQRWDEFYDVIMANPPFMTPKGGIKPHKRFSVQANRSEVLFVDYILEHLRPNGRAGIIVPEGIIFQSANAYKALRKLLVESGLLAVVSLPAGIFNPYSGVKTSILILNKNLVKKTDKILFIKVENDGFGLGAQRREVQGSDLPTALKIIKEYTQSLSTGVILNEVKNLSLALTEPIVKSIAHLVPKSKIAENGDYNLSGDRYKETNEHKNIKWPMVELGEVCEIYQPETITSKEIKSEGPYKVFGANGVIGYYDKYNHEESEVLITCRGATCGTVNLSEPKSWVTGNAMVVKPKSNNITKQSLFYFLKNSNLQSVISGSAQPQITRASLSPFKIPLPPLEVQKEIVEEIESYQKIIDGAKQIVTNYKPKIKINPEWEMVELGNKELFDIQSGGTPDSKNKEFWNGSINWITLVDLPVENFISEITESERKITEEGLNSSSAKLLPKNTIVVSSRATIGRVGIAREVLATNQGFKNIIIKKPKATNEKFVAFMMTTLVEQMNTMASGGTFKEISKTNFEKLKIYLPPLEVQNQIVSQIEEEEKIIDANKKLIEMFETKIKSKLAEVWGENE